MYDSVFKFDKDKHPTDLPVLDENWSLCSYREREKEILNFLYNLNGCLPASNLLYIKLGYFSIEPHVTLDAVRRLCDNFKAIFGFEVFQIAISRDKNLCFVLFDRIDREDGKTIYINRSQQIIMGVMVVKDLNLSRPSDTEDWLSYFVMAAYKENSNIFQELLELIKVKKFSKATYSLLRDIILLSEKRCSSQTFKI